MKLRIKIIYLLIALLASQSVWSMLDEHGFDSSGAQTADELRHDGHTANNKDDYRHSDDAESCIHCCHCHFHQHAFVLSSEPMTGQQNKEAAAFSYVAILRDAHPGSPFRPPIF